MGSNLGYLIKSFLLYQGFCFDFLFSPLQMHDSLTFLARYIQTRGRQLPDFGTFGITPLASIRIGRGKSHTTATSLATLGGERGAANKGVRPSSPHDPPHVLLRWHPLSGSIFALTVNSLWNSPLLLRSMTRPTFLVGVLNQKKSWLFVRLFCPSVWKTKTKQKRSHQFLYKSWFFFQMTKIQPKNTPTIFLYGIKMINCINMLSEKYQRFTPTKILRYKSHFIKEYTNNILMVWKFNWYWV